LRRIEAADIGCGSGGYDLRLLQNLGDKIHLYSIDSNPAMLAELHRRLSMNGIENYDVKRSPAEKIPLGNNCLDCVLTFNAIHHFKMEHFFEEVSRILKNRGFLFIYTRLRVQNRHSIWGKYFPKFYEKENRLYDLEDLKLLIHNCPNLQSERIKFFKYHRTSSLARLLKQARYHHYSTFDLYSDDEFHRALDSLKRNIHNNFNDLNHITWTDGNVLFVIKKKEVYFHTN
jgi:ubiquinone/menaquinone biosynthesis C-methylase UbiE